MKSVRFSKVVEKSGRPEVYLLMSETDPEFHKALDAGKIMSLSDDSHGAGTEYGKVGYDKKRRGQLLLFPKSLKSFADAKIIGIKYDLFAEPDGQEPSRTKEPKKSKSKTRKASAKLPKRETKKKQVEPKPKTEKVIPFQVEEEEQDDDHDHLKAFVRQAMRALEKGNSVAAYNILKRVIPDP
jgi:hypothetical protein